MLLTEINTNIYLGCVSPNVVPDIVCKKLWPTSAICSRSAREDAVDVSEGPTGASSEVVPLVQVNAQRIYSRNANDCTLVSLLRFPFRIEVSNLCH